MLVRIACLAIGYVFGLFQTSYIYGRMHGIDIRNYGSGNAGTTNMLRTLGTKAGVITFVGDCLKCVLAVLVALALFKDSHQDMVPLLKLYAAAGTILGHNYPFYLGFRGGKGIAATAGLGLAFDGIMCILGYITFIVVFLATHYVSLGSLMVYAGLVIEIVIFGQMGHFGMTQPLLNELYILAYLLAVLALWKHRQNIVRLVHGEERKTYLTKKNKS